MRPVVLFYTCEAGRDANRYAGVLAQHGYEMRHCPDTAALRSNLRRAVGETSQSGEPVIAVLAAAASLNRAAANILAASPQVGVLAQLDACDDATLIATLQSGADAWCPRNCSPEVLVLALHSLTRRLERGGAGMGSMAPGLAPSASQGPMADPRPPPEPAGRWLLREQAWQLETPSGGRVQLTSSERDFMLRLAEHPDRSASHAELLQGRVPAKGDRARSRLGVLVSRLRHKVAQQGDELPIKSLYNWGYMFTGDLALCNAAPQAGHGRAIARRHGAASQEGRRLKTMLSR